ncbi:3-dehydroquinate synthase [Clostridium pascui]|uniref:3-dehydroquinate synthase n=1 Tax=Clostridium pascui TaxID=46609 RepID=UPI00195CB620|nr:3-dehydroquinate synthase [Clostridium pascui]MBM7872112.1 3-dehydroquinate synthase [Clostridium pascui]
MELRINLTEQSYPIYIGRGVLGRLGEEIKKIYSNKKIAVVTDENVDKFYGEKVKSTLEKSGFQVFKIVVKPGEKSKSIEELVNLYNNILDAEITRGDLIIALGGGVVGDLTGFAASTLLRGIPYIQIPTSLLAQIDSSIGGKVAVDLPRGKNLVGNFYHPQAVFIDPDVLDTLDKRFFYDGMAEVIKYGCIKNKELFYKLMECDEKRILESIEDIIYTCCCIKKEVVEKDEKDNHDRMILNFGHTLGHAIEKYYNFEKYTHGEAVALGMYIITKKSEEMNLTKKGTAELIGEVLSKHNLEHEIYLEDRESILKAISFDKKSKGEFIDIILLKDIGESFIHKIEKEKISSFI